MNGRRSDRSSKDSIGWQASRDRALIETSSRKRGMGKVDRLTFSTTGSESV